MACVVEGGVEGLTSRKVFICWNRSMVRLAVGIEDLHRRFELVGMELRIGALRAVDQIRQSPCQSNVGQGLAQC